MSVLIPLTSAYHHTFTLFFKSFPLLIPSFFNSGKTQPLSECRGVGYLLTALLFDTDLNTRFSADCRFDLDDLLHDRIQRVKASVPGEHGCSCLQRHQDIVDAADIVPSDCPTLPSHHRPPPSATYICLSVCLSLYFSLPLPPIFPSLLLQLKDHFISI